MEERVRQGAQQHLGRRLGIGLGQSTRDIVTADVDFLVVLSAVQNLAFRRARVKLKGGVAH